MDIVVCGDDLDANRAQAYAIESMNVRSGGATAVAESVAKFGISITVFGNCGVTVEMARTRTGLDAPARLA